MDTFNIQNMTTEEQQDRAIQEVFRKEGRRLFNFIRRSVPEVEDAEDIAQDVYYQFVDSYRNLREAENSSAWLFRVARNRITDFFRKKRPVPESQLKTPTSENEEGTQLGLLDILPDTNNNPESQLFRETILDALEEALDELPIEQRQVFVWHELEGRSFKEISAQTGEKVKTLISRKRYAVLYLREALSDLYEELYD